MPHDAEKRPGISSGPRSNPPSPLWAHCHRDFELRLALLEASGGAIDTSAKNRGMRLSFCGEWLGSTEEAVCRYIVSLLILPNPAIVVLTFSRWALRALYTAHH
jgi:hypothetical protein